MRIFISGGCKNGKSFYAQRLAKDAACSDSGASLPLYYVATMKSVDSEDDERIARHVDERAGWGFTTIEQHERIEEILQRCDNNGSFLLDSLTALLAEEMFRSDGSVDDQAAVRIEQGISQVLDSVSNIVIVSDYIYSDAAVFDPLTELYRKSLAMLDRAAAKMCDVVLEISFSGVIVHKNSPLWRGVA